jgi:hypothetical protein
MFRLVLATALVAGCALALVPGKADAACKNLRLCVPPKQIQVNPPFPPPCIQCGKVTVNPGDMVVLPQARQMTTIR